LGEVCEGGLLTRPDRILRRWRGDHASDEKGGAEKKGIGHRDLHPDRCKSDAWRPALRDPR